MALYRKKPVAVEAMRYGPSSMPSLELCLFLEGTGAKVSSDGISLPTTKGTVLVAPGEWIIKQSSNDFYPCSDEVFKRNYTIVIDFTTEGPL
jgi:hypothetical protein